MLAKPHHLQPYLWILPIIFSALLNPPPQVFILPPTDGQGDDGGLPPDFLPNLTEIAQNTAASVTVFQAGLASITTEMAGIRSELSSLRGVVRQGLEVTV